MSGRLDFDAIKREHPLPAVVQHFGIQLRAAGREFKACCPFHDEKTPSFTVFAGRRGWIFNCHGCGAGGDVLDFVRTLRGVTLPQAAALLEAAPVETLEVDPCQPEDDLAVLAVVRSLWRAADPAPGTLVDTYLREVRGLSLPIPPTIRFARLHYGKRGPLQPAMLAAVTNADGRLTGVQRTYLAHDGKGKLLVAKPKLSRGRIKGGAIRLAPAAARQIVTEGIEDALTLQQQLGQGAWAAAGAGFLPAMRFPPLVREVVIGADADAAGRREAEKAASAFSSRGLSVRVIYPEPGFKDFNDQLRGQAGK